MQLACHCHAHAAYFNRGLISGIWGTSMMSLKAVGILAGALLLAGVGAAALANPENHGNRDRQKDDKDRHEVEGTVTQRFIKIRMEDGSVIEIDTMVIFIDPNTVVGAVTDDGVRRANEDKVDLSGLPVVGGLFGGNSSSSAGRDQPVRVGSAHLLGPTMVINLSSGTPIGLDPESVQPVGEQKLYGQSLRQQIRDILSTRPQPAQPSTNALRSSAYGIDGVRVMNDKYSYAMPSSAFRPLDIGGTPAAGQGRPLSPEQIKEIKELLGEPAGRAYLEGAELTVLVQPYVRGDYYPR